MKVSRVFGALILSILPLLHLPAEAEERNPLFDKDSARNIFNEDIFLTGEGDIDYLRPPKPDETFDVRDPEEKKEDQALKDIRRVPESPEELVQSFGNPFEVYPVLAQESAPKPFKGMMAALEMGQEELATAYARQYWNYMERLNGRASQVSTIVEQIGVEEAKKAKLSSAVDEDNVSPSPAGDSTSGNGHTSLKSKADAILEKAKHLEAQEKRDEIDTAALSQNQPPHRPQPDVQQSIPVAPDGIVDIYFFFRPEEKAALLMSKEVQALFERTKENPKVKLIGFTIERTPPDTIESYRQKTGATFPIADGSELALRLKSVRSPTTVFMARNIGRSHTEEGPREERQLLKVLKSMQGGK